MGQLVKIVLVALACPLLLPLVINEEVDDEEIRQVLPE